MKRILILFLAVLFFVLAFAGCSSKKKQTKNDDNGNSGEAGENNAEEVETSLPAKNWGGRELKVIELNSELESAVFASEDDITNSVSAVVYSRNEAIKAKYNFSISTVRASGEQTKRPSDIIEKESNSGECSYDLVIDSVSYMKGALSHFMFCDLTALPYIDWNASCWDEKANNELSILGHRFVCTGDLNLLEKSGASVIYCNRNILDTVIPEDEDFRQEVLDGEWTMERMVQLMRAANRVDADETVEIYGLLNQGHGVFVNFMQATCGMKFTENDDQGIPHFTFDDAEYFEQTLKWIDDVLAFYSKKNLTYTQRYSGTRPNSKALFKDGRGLFFAGELGDVIDLQKTATFTYTTLPYPIYDPEIQTEYTTALDYSFSGLMAIPYYAADPEFSAFALQAMNERSGDLMHLFVEDKCKIKGSVDATDYKLMTLALSNGSYDLGAVYNWGALKTWIFQDYRPDDNKSIPVGGENNFATLWAQDKDLAHEELREFMERFQQAS